MKMYIAVLNTVPDHMVPVLVAHTVLGAHNTWAGYEMLDYDEWFNDSYRKCVIGVNEKEFQKIQELDNVYLGYENSVLDARHSCAVVCPRKDNPNVLKFAKLWKPKCENL